MLLRLLLNHNYQRRNWLLINHRNDNSDTTTTTTRSRSRASDREGADSFNEMLWKSTVEKLEKQCWRGGVSTRWWREPPPQGQLALKVPSVLCGMCVDGVDGCGGTAGVWGVTSKVGVAPQLSVASFVWFCYVCGTFCCGGLGRPGSDGASARPVA